MNIRPLLIVVALCLSWPAFAQTPGGWSPIGGSTSLSVSSVSANVALPGSAAFPAAQATKICNTGGQAAYVAFGLSSVVAYTTTSGANLAGSYLAAGVCQLYSPPSSAGYIAAITTTSTTTLVIESGTGSPQSTLPGGAGGVGAPMQSGAANATLPTARNNLGFLTVELQDAVYGGAADAVISAVTLTAGQTSFSGLTGTPKAKQAIVVPGVGANGSPLLTTFSSPTALAVAPTYSTGTFYSPAGALCPVVANGGAVGASYAPGDTWTPAGGTANLATQCTVDYTQVVAATINAAGTGGAVTGTCTFTGTTGTSPTRFFGTAAMSAGGALTGAITITINGAYSVNPTLTAEPVTAVSGCGSLTGATVNLGMGVFHAYKSKNGNYSVSPIAGGATGTGTVAQGATSGSGTGATISLTYNGAGTTYSDSDGNPRGPVYGTDNTPALNAILALTTDAVLQVPKGQYLLTSCTQVTAQANLQIKGDNRDLSRWILADECAISPTSVNGWITWSGVKATSGSVRDLSLDLRNPVKNVTPQWFAFLFNATRGIVERNKILNGGPWVNPVGIAGAATFTLVNPKVNFNYLTQAGDHVPMECILYSVSSGTIDRAEALGNTCAGGGIQMDGTNIRSQLNDTSGFGFGTGQFIAGTATGGQIAANVAHDTLLGFDVNMTPAGGVENDGANIIVTANQANNVGGSGTVNFGANASILGNNCVKTGRAKGMQGSQLDSKLYGCVRMGTGGSGTVAGNTGSDDGTGDMQYLYTEDASFSGAVKLLANIGSGSVGTNNTVAATTTIDDFGWANTHTSVSAPTGTTSTSANNVMMGLAGSITPVKTGRMMIHISGNTRNSGAGDGCVLQIRYGTGAAPANGVVGTGTAVGLGITTISSAAGQQIGVETPGIVSGLTLNTPYWLDWAFRALTAGTCTAAGVDVWANEF